MSSNNTQVPEKAEPLAYDAEEFVARAEECARLANITKDEMIQTELLQLREIYLQTANRLVQQRKAEDRR